MQLTREIIKAAVKAHYKPTPKKVASSRLEREKEKEEQRRAKLVGKAVASLTKNLPTADFPANNSYKTYRRMIVEAAFQSAVAAGYYFLSVKDRLHIEIGNEVLPVSVNDVIPVIEPLIEWAGVGNQKLKDEKGKPFDKFVLQPALTFQAILFKSEEQKLSTSSDHLNILVSAMGQAIWRRPENLNRAAVMDSFVKQLARVVKHIGQEYYHNRSGDLYLNCADQRHGLTKLSTKVVLPYFQAIIDNSSVAGKFRAKNDAATLLQGFINKTKLL